MSKVFFFVLASILSFFTLQASLSNQIPFYVCTVANYKHPNLEKLEKSCKLHGIDLTVLGMGSKYEGHGRKLLLMIDYLATLNDTDIVMFVDAFDVLIVADKSEILKKFLKTNESLIMGAEKNCYPAHNKKKYPAASTPFKYINTGTYIGYVKNIREWILSLQPFTPEVNDQVIASDKYIKDPKNRCFVLDYKCSLFLPLFNVSVSEVKIKKDKVYCVTTGSHPCVVHANGNSFKIWNQIYEALIANK